MSPHAVAVPAAGSSLSGAARPPSNRPVDEPISSVARAGLDRVLELIEQRRLSATELRLLLYLVDHEAGLTELADALGQQHVKIRRASRSLAMRGLIRWLHVGRREETRFGITANGLATIRAFLTEAGQAREPHMPKAAIP